MTASRAQIRDMPGFFGQALGYLRDPGVASWRKLIGLVAVVYTAWPLDIVPDFIPLVGWLDDIGIVGLAMAWIVREVRRHAARTPHV